MIIGLLIGAPLGWYFSPHGTPPSTILKTTGSNTIFPLSQKWAEEYHAQFPSVQIDVAGGGSGQGQTSVALGIVDFGASSSYPSYNYRIANPGVRIIPVAADALAIICNNAVNSTGMKLTRMQVIAIFNGSITTWEDFETTFSVSVEATGLIEVFVRSEASGTTATFGAWLSVETYPNGTRYWTLGSQETISWPGQANFHGVEGNDGVKAGVDSNGNAIGYVGLAFTDGVIKCDLWNPGNNAWVTPSFESAKLAIPAPMTNASASLFDSPTVGAYPVARLLFYLVNTDPAVYPVYHGVRQSTVGFLFWALNTGQNPDWIRVNVGYLEITGTGAYDYSMDIIGGITPVPG